MPRQWAKGLASRLRSLLQRYANLGRCPPWHKSGIPPCRPHTSHLLVPPLSAPRQVLRVAGEQHGVFAVPALRTCLRVTNPSAALLAVLSQVGYVG